jgi:hypothetical protein
MSKKKTKRVKFRVISERTVELFDDFVVLMPVELDPQDPQVVNFIGSEIVQTQEPFINGPKDHEFALAYQITDFDPEKTHRDPISFAFPEKLPELKVEEANGHQLPLLNDKTGSPYTLGGVGDTTIYSEIIKNEGLLTVIHETGSGTCVQLFNFDSRSPAAFMRGPTPCMKECLDDIKSYINVPFLEDWEPPTTI